MRTLLLILAALPAIACANPPRANVSLPGATPPVADVTATGGQATAITNNTTLNTNLNNNSSTSGAASTATGGGGVSSNSLSINGPRLAQAPDVIAYPTAPCRVSIGASGGWIGGALGFSGSTEDEGCTLRETSRQLWNIGQHEAATQILCLNADARTALEAAGVKCRIERVVAERVVP